MFKNCIETESAEEGCYKVADTSHVEEMKLQFIPSLRKCYSSMLIFDKCFKQISLLFINKFVLAFISKDEKFLSDKRS